MTAYVYTWFRPDWTPFYVGIGKTPSRWNPTKTKQKDRNPLCWRILQKYGASNIHVQRKAVESWAIACAMEMSLIAHFGRISDGGLLANFTDGGEGVANPSANVTERRRARLLDPANPMREYHKILNTDLAVRARRNAATQSPEAVERRRATNADPERKSKRLAALAATIATPEYQAKLALRRKLKPVRMTPAELSVYRSALLKARNADPEYQATRIAALKNASEKISAGVFASMDARLATMRTPDVQEKLRRPKSAEHKRKISEAKLGVPHKR